MEDLGSPCPLYSQLPSIMTLNNDVMHVTGQHNDSSGTFVLFVEAASMNTLLIGAHLSAVTLQPR